LEPARSQPPPGGGRAMRPRLGSAIADLPAHARADSSRWTHRVGVALLRPPTSPPPPGTPSDLARLSSPPHAKVLGGPSPWRSNLPPQGGGAAARCEAMRDLSGDLRHLSVNSATLRKQLALPDMIEACARRGIGIIDPWRDQVQAAGLDAIARQLKDAGITLSGYCRGGFFPAADA